jgi:hypothetical protein
MALTSAQANILKQSSPDSIERGLRSLATDLASGRWLNAGNRYCGDASARVQDDVKRNTLNSRDLCEYVAASAPTHCIDGWSYWGRALDAHLRGDSDTATHLGYYASLRAGMSLLASQGIGVFNTNHIVIDSAGAAREVEWTRSGAGFRPLGTHEFVWEALQAWAKESAPIVLDFSRPAGRSLRTWLDGFGGTGPSRAIAVDWISVWGLDLQRFADDRSARNISSYQPSQMSNQQAIIPARLSEFTRDLWGMLQPSSSPFDILDKHILRRSVRRAFALKGLGAHTEHTAEFARAVQDKLQDMFDIESERERYYLFITKPASEASLFSLAEQHSSVSDPGHHLEVLARAALLLRLASGSVQRLFERAGMSGHGATKGLEHLLVARGIGESGLTGVGLQDLWGDVELAILEEEDWHIRNVGQNVTMKRWRDEQNTMLTLFGEGERVAAWGLGL